MQYSEPIMTLYSPRSSDKLFFGRSIDLEHVDSQACDKFSNKHSFESVKNSFLISSQ